VAKLNRRDFLKVASLVPLTVGLSSVAPRALSLGAQNSALPNVIIIVFDAMTAKNLSLYGYHRKTTPNFERFAERATVYNAHHSAGNFTTPGTASLLTGMYPWTHRAINISGLIKRDLVEQNIFRAFGKEYHRLAYSQNLYPNHFFNQFYPEIDQLVPATSFSVANQVMAEQFPRDKEAVSRAYDEFLFGDGNPPASLVFGLAERLLFRRQGFAAQVKEYPNGLPRTAEYPIFYKLKNVVEGIIATIAKLNSPFLAYFHVFSPHAPYRPTIEFIDRFNDNWHPIKKPDHRFGDHITTGLLWARRKNYDEYIANVDAEFGRLIDSLDAQGILENSYLVLTSDHGENFERGQDSHITPLLYEPLINIPLMISAPGQRSRSDIVSPTNSVDVLPTLLHLTGHDIPDWCEGALLPGLGGKEDIERSMFAVEAKSNPAFSPLKTFTIVMRKGNYKLIYYKGYESEESFELYDLGSDPEELSNLYSAQTAVANRLKDELLAKLNSVNQAYQR
jgi:arylsulfatase A-like enzyme